MCIAFWATSIYTSCCMPQPECPFPPGKQSIGRIVLRRLATIFRSGDLSERTNDGASCRARELQQQAIRDNMRDP